MVLSFRLQNRVPVRRRRWVTVTAPTVHASGYQAECRFVTDDGRSWRAVKGNSRGCRTAFRIRGEFWPNEKVRGVLQNLQHPDAALPFALHPWVADDVKELVPTLYSSDRDGTGALVSSLDELTIDMVDKSPAHQRWRVCARILDTGLHFWWWADIFHADPVVDVRGKVIWSKRDDPAVSQQFNDLAILAGERIAFDFAEAHGMPAPVETGDGKWWHRLNDTPVPFIDGSGLPLSGAMLCHRSRPGGKPLEDEEDSIMDLVAASQGEVVGVCENWDDLFLANGHLARWDLSGGGPSYPDQIADHTDAAFQDEIEKRRGWFAPRPLGCARTPSQTGGQQDFGATKGTLATVLHDPRHILPLRYSVQSDLFRGFNHYEADGTILKPAAHPKWVALALGRTHWHQQVSPDRLGKGTATGDGTGWASYDEDHRSQNCFAAYLALSDDPMAEDQVDHILVAEQCSYGVRIRKPGDSLAAARGHGRTLGAIAQIASVCNNPQFVYFARAAEHRIKVIQQAPTMAVPGPMKVIAYGNPDPRKPIYDPAGNLAPFVSMWEHGLALVGIWQATKMFTEQTAIFKSVAMTIAETMAHFGCFQSPDGKWYTVNDLIWNGGQPPPGGMVPPNPEPEAKNQILAGEGIGGTRDWTFAGLLIARKILRDPALVAKLNNYVEAITGGEDTNNLSLAEWCAAVPSVQPVTL